MESLLHKIYKTSLNERKSLAERAIKLQEECGELAQEILIDQKASGSHHKPQGDDGILGECADIALVALSIYFYKGGTPDTFLEHLATKCEKWERFQTKSD